MYSIPLNSGRSTIAVHLERSQIISRVNGDILLASLRRMASDVPLLKKKMRFGGTYSL